MDGRKIGNTIIKYRKVLGMTQEKLGECVGVSKSSVSKWETGRTIPDVEVLIRLSGLYGITIDQILNERPERIKIQSLEEIKDVDEEQARAVLSCFSSEELAKAVMGTSPEIYVYISQLFPAIDIEKEIAKAGRVRIEELEEIHDRIVGQMNLWEK